MPPGSDRVRPILERLLAFDPVCRYASANELIEDMRERLGAEFLGDEAWTTPPKPMTSEIVEEAPPQAEPAARRVWSRRLVLVGGTLLLLALLLFAGVIVYHMEQQGKLDATMANFQGFIADSQGRTTEAETLFLRAIDVDPGVAHYWRDLGDFYVKYGRSEKAIHYYRKTLELDASDDETSRRLKALEVGTTATTQTAERSP
jgi:tetratricopeptide (TPR) repeat protein